MRKGIVGILICMLFIVQSITTVSGFEQINNTSLKSDIIKNINEKNLDLIGWKTILISVDVNITFYEETTNFYLKSAGNQYFFIIAHSTNMESDEIIGKVVTFNGDSVLLCYKYLRVIMISFSGDLNLENIIDSNGGYIHGDVGFAYIKTMVEAPYA